MSYEPREGMYSGAYLPHTEAEGRPQMITTRLRDSLPRSVFAERLDLASSSEERDLLRQRFLDMGRGRCVLENTEIGEMVAEAIQFYDGDKYQLVEWVVMPNHVHFVYRKPRASMGSIVGAIKSYTSHRINRILGESGPNWQIDFHDRYARDRDHFFNMSCYTLLNPVHAGLVDDPADWPFSSIHTYGPEHKDELRQWYRTWQSDFWGSVADA